jgi:eukaryotic-like serine/threonine-protein kinase
MLHSAPPAATDACAGAMLGPYRILECIGDGAMGRVYRAEHVELRRPAAIKFLLPYYAADPEAVSRFLQEAKAVNMVRHANLVDVYDVFVEPERGIRAYVMELLTGRSLRDAMMQETLGLATVLSITRQVASALHAVHGAGIVHRDLKPENVYLCAGADGGTAVKVLDFGVAKFTRGDVPYQTRNGTVVGSPWYMAPEQASGEAVDHRADVYSLGVLLYEMLTGRVPFPGYDYASVIRGQVTAVPPPLRRHDGWEPPASVGAVVLRCLEKDPAARPRDMAALWTDLAAAAGPRFSLAPSLVPSLDARSPAAAPDAPRRHRPRAWRSMRRLTVLSFSFGIALGLYGLAATSARTPEAPAIARNDPPPASRPAPARPQAPAASPPVAQAAPGPPRAAPRRHVPKAAPTAKPSRWSKAAFDKKRERASWNWNRATSLARGQR